MTNHYQMFASFSPFSFGVLSLLSAGMYSVKKRDLHRLVHSWDRVCVCVCLLLFCEVCGHVDICVHYAHCQKIALCL